MSDHSAGLSRQAIMLLLLFSCIAIGLKTLLVGILPSQPVPQAWDLTIAGALALTLAGLALCSVILNVRFSWRLGLAVVLIIYGVASLFLQDWNAGLRFETTTERFWLAPLPAGLVMLMGLCCGLGLRPRARLLWRISGALSVVFGTLVIIGDLNGMTGFDLVRWPARPRLSALSLPSCWA